MPKKRLRINALKGKEKESLQLARRIERREKSKKRVFKLTEHIGRYLKSKKLEKTKKSKAIKEEQKRK